MTENISGRKLTQVLNSVGSVLVHQETADWGSGRDVTSATPVSGTGITGGGSGYAALLAHAG